jgi:hypothetical protein
MLRWEMSSVTERLVKGGPDRFPGELKMPKYPANQRKRATP